MDKLSSLIPKVLKKRGLGDQAIASYAVFLANECISEHLPEYASMARAESFSAGVIHISTDHSVAAHEIQQCADTIRQYVNRYEGISVNEIRVFRKN